jgi:small subunit ribosomal protein S15
MALPKELKAELIENFKTHTTDTGSPEVQVALLSKRISQLTTHLQAHRHDHSSRRGLLMIIGQRRRLLNYLTRKNTDRYRAVIGKLGLRK